MSDIFDLFLPNANIALPEPAVKAMDPFSEVVMGLNLIPGRVSVVKNTGETRLSVPIVKKAVEQRHGLAIVATPGEVDAHEEVISAPTIEKAAHQFMIKSQRRGIMHTILANEKIKLIESWIAPVTFKIGKRKILKGTWLVKFFFADLKVWKDVKAGKLLGVSLGGKARKVTL